MSRRSRRRDADLRRFERDDSAEVEPSVRRQLFTWPGEDEYSPSSLLPRPFVKSVDYVPEADPFVPLGLSRMRSELFSVPDAAPLAWRPVHVSYGPSRKTLRSVLRPEFVGARNPCHARAVRREVMFAIGKGGTRLGTKKVHRTSDSERSC